MEATVGHYSDVQAERLASDELQGVSMRRLIGPEHGWDSHAMRLFTVEPGGHTPRHTHPWPHINLVLSGSGVVRTGDAERSVEPGSYAFLPAGLEHQFRNTGTEDLVFMCIVPEGDD